MQQPAAGAEIGAGGSARLGAVGKPSAQLLAVSVQLGKRRKPVDIRVESGDWARLPVLRAV